MLNLLGGNPLIGRRKMLYPSRGMDVASGVCKKCRKPYHHNYRICTFRDAAEESLFVEVFTITRNYCSNKCLPKDLQRKVSTLVGELSQRKKALKDFRHQRCGLEGIS